jgi:DNA-directed RNA polymerase subunit RPC12/RpoP
MEIDCLACGKTIKIPDFIDTNSYDGQITCSECKSLLHIKLVGAKVRKYEVVEKKPRGLTAIESAASRKTGGEAADVESIAKYNPLRDFLATYRATQLQLVFEQIEGIIGSELEKEAYTFKSWWENDSRNPQATAWLQAGWEVVDVSLPQRRIILRRVEQP